MNNKKVAVILDNPRLSYFTKNGDFNWDNCNTGKALNELLTAPRKGMGLNRKQYKYFFAYPKLPDVNPAGKPKNVTKSQINQYKEQLLKGLFEFSPDLIIGLGTVALKSLGVEGSMQANRGVPQELTYTYNGQSKKIMTLITYNYETTLVSPYIKGYIQADFKLGKKYLEKGNDAFKVNTSVYEYVDNFDRVKEIFELLKDDKKYPVVALDTETNSINPELEGAKLLDISISWEKGQGVIIPLKHKDTPFTDEQVQEIYNMINELMESSRYKVFHKGVFDIQFMYACTGLQFARNCLDTQIMHYVAVSEEHTVSRGLKQLTLQYLDMGDYAKPLTTFKKEMVKKHRESFLAKYEELKNTENKIKKSDYRPLVNEIDGGNFNYEWIPLDILYPYAAADTDATLRLYYVFKELVDANDKWKNLIYNFYPKLSDSIALIQHNGIKFSQSRVNELNKNYDTYLGKLDKKIRENENVQELESDRQAKLDILLAEKAKPVAERNKDILKKYDKLKGTKKDPLKKVRFNPRSTDDLKQLLFVYCGYELPFERDFMTPKAQDDRVSEEQWDLQYYSVGAKTLEYLAKEYNDDFINTLAEYKTLYKLQNDFIKKLPRMADDNDLVHPHFGITGTKTSRLNSTGPNAQQLRAYRGSNPKDFEYFNTVKSMFVSRFEGGVLLNCDFTSLEIYIAALVSQDKSMVQILLDDNDYHEMTARQAFKIPDNKPCPPEMRQNAKSVSFGLLYGRGAASLADQLGESVPEAEKLFEAILDSKPGLRQTIEDTEKFVKKYKYVDNLAGFRRRLSAISSKNKSVSSGAQRMAFNSIIQGSGAFCTNTALNTLRRAMYKLHMKSKIALTVHDSILVDAHPDEVAQIAYLTKYVMEHLDIPFLFEMSQKGFNVPDEYKLPNGNFRFPLRAELEIGTSYGTETDYDAEEMAKYPNAYDYAKASWDKKVQRDIESHKE